MDVQSVELKSRAECVGDAEDQGRALGREADGGQGNGSRVELRASD